MRGNPGRYVKTKSGKTGRTKNSDSPKDGKILVYITDDNFRETGEKVLCDPKDLTGIGFID